MNMHKIAAFTLAGLLSSAALAAGNTGTGTETDPRDSMGHSTEQPGAMGGTGSGMDSTSDTGKMPDETERPETTTGSDHGTGVDAGGDGAAAGQGKTGKGGAN
ncbi:hypothetical protein GFL09_15135 [Pseudomonas stutzeri]|uniref:hypothetical protein n=1 Tax=Stutzerimonas stutzeri TaxID=316 RepID=UPI0019095BB2|nr:hypothetical protein [Stutzerimonas stutzeri]MBK3869002.1 hypothetical protein [Stutzerimonas stutzeri]